MQLELFKVDKPVYDTKEGKTCIVCGDFKPYEMFDKHTGHKDNHDGRCKSCKREQVNLRNDLRKTAPEKPTTCECCEKEYPSRLIVLDHCHDSKEFRGWICHYCNAGIGQLGDTVEGLERAIRYLKKNER